LPAEPFIGKGRALAGGKLTVEPGRAFVADLPVKAGGRQDADTDVRTLAGEVVSLAARGKVGGNAPVIGVDPLDMAGPAQRFQPADMGADESVRVAAHVFDSVVRPLQMYGRAIGALRIGDIHDVAVGRAWTGRAGAGRYDHAPANLLGARGVQFEVVNTPVHTIDDQPDAFAHLVVSQPL